jgi:hypothetical protein
LAQSLTFNAETGYAYVRSWVVDSNSDLVQGGDAGTSLFVAKTEPDYLLPFTILDHRLHVLGVVSRTEIRDAARVGLGVDYFWGFGAKVQAELDKTKYYVSRVGLGATYVYQGDLHGWSFGVEVS